MTNERSGALFLVLLASVACSAERSEGDEALAMHVDSRS